MKKCNLLLLAVALFKFNYGQVVFSDAVKLSTVKNTTVVNGRVVLNIDTSNVNFIDSILVNYISKTEAANITDKNVLKQKIANAFRNNPFINIGGKVEDDELLSPQLKKQPFSFTPSSLISSIGGLNVTNFADGLAKFLVKRFKEELTITFFQKFKNVIDTSVELKTLFPQTYNVLHVIDKDIYQFSIYLNTIREGFIKDLTNLYTNFKKFKNISRYKTFFDENKELYTIMVNAFYFIDQYAAGIHAGEVLANYDTADLQFNSAPLQHNMQNAVAIAQAFSYSFKSSSAEHYWVPADSIGMFFKIDNDVSWDLYFGLMYQKYGAISFDIANGTQFIRLDSLLAKAKREAASLKPYKDFVETFISHIQEINEYVTELKGKKKEDIDFNDYYKLYNASLDLLAHGFSFLDLPFINIDPGIVENIKLQSGRWIYVARTAADLYIDVRTKNYSSAILNTCSIIDTVFLNCTNDVRTNILKYGAFAAAVATATTSDEVEAAIESIALPSGSSRVKRESAVNISLNSYVGGTAGWEYLPVLKDKQTSTAAGFTAQVGVAFSIGHLFKGSNEKAGGKSLTLFVPIIDVGALASFRLHDDSSKVASEVQLKNIFAPGAFVYFGFGRCPISIGAGAQIGPQLRQVTATNINVDKNYYIRYGISVCVDIPLLNFYTKSK